MMGRSRFESSVDRGDGVIEFGWRIRSTQVGSNTGVVTASMDGAGDSTDDNETERANGAEIVQPLGIAARPKISANSEAVIARSGDDIVVLAVIDKSAQPVATDEGDTIVYATGKPRECYSRYKDDGSIRVFMSAGKDMRINDGAVPVAHEGSITTGHLHVASPDFVIWMTQVATICNVVVPGFVFPVVSPTVVLINTDTIAIGAGTQHLKVVDT